ncbi:hypothetical protein GF1_13480 [Desulfolithobacter dissulfuricans]|uniref:histidine kinase n=1 Tax=Desulfolithobacter dissulfuricans TaxID=2795293 RepID=A0A915U1X4_9BACT|nr:response regulator [Desulfolithobacter dissulfuricans]BCO08972.1 hypothetical protein GF1_13480 [Desulfolithobacter dissulfuricans]
MLLLREITKVKEAEILLRDREKNYLEIFNATSEAIFIHDADNGKILDANHSVSDMFGYSHEEVLQLSINDLNLGAYPYSQQEAVHLVKRAVEQGPQLFEWKARKKSGECFWTEVALKSSEVGGQRRVIAVVRDITDRKQAEQDKEKLDIKIRQVQKIEAIGTLAGGIAHDFNNILAAILGYGELALNKLPAGSPLAADIEQVLMAGTRAKELVKQILTFSRQSEHNVEPIQLHPIIKEALKLLRASIPASIEIKQDIDPNCGSVLADPTQIHQVIMNLCTNAYHAMRENGGVLSVSLLPVTIEKNDKKASSLAIAPGDYVKLEVSDTGHGIDQDTLEKIFDPYFTTKSIGEGSGMGLSVVHGIIKSIGGHIMAYSEPGMGATFNIYLPRIKYASENREIVNGESPPRGKEKILFVDDEATIAQMGRQMLESLGYRVKSLTSSQAALEEFQIHPEYYDLVITDMAMPKMTGSELTEKLLAIKQDIPIILCTGFSEMMNKDKAKSIGIREYLMKPVTMLDLAKAVREVLDKK